MPYASLRERSAVLIGRVAGAATRRLGRGGGTALPGLVASRIAPGLLSTFARALADGVVTVTGTNGKTTTAHLLTAIARADGREVVANDSGSNMERGLVSMFVDASGSNGAHRLGVLEIDEAELPRLYSRLRPRVAVFLNLFRDQLDRYGEVDSVAEGWASALAAADAGSTETTLVLNADDPSVARLAVHSGGPVVTFGVDDPAAALPGREHAADARFCACGARFEYSAVHMGHVGHWRCPACGEARAAPDVSARRIVLQADRTEVDFTIAGEPCRLTLPLAGLYSVYNALAAAAAAHALGIAADVITASLAQAAPAFGRQEEFALDGRTVRMWLAKNPTGLNEVLRALVAAGPSLCLLVLLNDGIQDGRDVSWIYDADVERLTPLAPSVVCSGDRAADLGLRFALAGIEPALVEPDAERALDAALARTPAGGRLEVVPTYTAMLHMRELLARRTGVASYWEDTRT